MLSGKTWTRPLGIDMGGWPHLLCVPEAFSSPGRGIPLLPCPSCSPVPSPSGMCRVPAPWFFALHPLTSSARKGGQAFLLAEIQPGQVFGFRGQRVERDIARKCLLPQSQCSYLPAHMIYWDILHVPSVSTLPENARGGHVTNASLHVYWHGLRERG